MNSSCRQASIVLLGVIAILLQACVFRTNIYYQDGMKVTHKSRDIYSRSTNHTDIGKEIYCDSASGNKVKIVKYRTKNGCFRHEQRKLIEITFDSAGNRIGRENVLRERRKTRKAMMKSGQMRKITKTF